MVVFGGALLHFHLNLEQCSWCRNSQQTAQVILAGDLLGMPVAVKLPLANASLSLPDLANELLTCRCVVAGSRTGCPKRGCSNLDDRNGELIAKLWTCRGLLL